MAAQDRPERHLMRQRGQGTRSAADVDFGLEFGGGGAREQRQLMRQRGAGNRKITNIDFGFSFPTPGQSRRSRSKTPHTSAINVSRTSKTPARASREPSVPESRRRKSVRQPEISSTQRRAAKAHRLSQSPIPTTSKRRQLSESSNRKVPKNTTPGALKALRQARAPSRSTLPVSEEHITPQRINIDANTEEREFDAQPGSVLEEEGDKENPHQVSESLKTQPKQKKRKSIGQKSLRRKKRTSAESEQDSVLPSVEVELEESYQEDTADLEPDLEPADELESFEEVLSTGNQPEVQQKQSAQRHVPTQVSKKRKKRKSVVLGRKKRRSSGNTTINTHDEQQVEQPDSTTQQPTHTEANGNDAEQEVISREAANSASLDLSAHVQRTATFPRLNSEERFLRQNEGDEEEDETYMPDDATPEATPAPKRKRTANKRSSDASSSNQPAAKRRNSTFPIVTHRIANADALPTIVEEGDGDDGGRETDEHIPSTFSSRAVPNGVDVLAQICRETIASAVDKLDSHKDPNVGRAELKRKRAALETLGSDLDDRLFDMSQAVEQRLTLESRLRKSKREKAELQALWIEVRRQREQLALKSDAVRRQHWEDEEQAKKRWEISQAAMTMEMEIERGGDEEQGDSLEFLLTSLSADVSRKSENGGILNRVKVFNGQLERLALALERR